MCFNMVVQQRVVQHNKHYKFPQVFYMSNRKTKYCYSHTQQLPSLPSVHRVCPSSVWYQVGPHRAAG